MLTIKIDWILSVPSLFLRCVKHVVSKHQFIERPEDVSPFKYEAVEGLNSSIGQRNSPSNEENLAFESDRGRFDSFPTRESERFHR